MSERPPSSAAPGEPSVPRWRQRFESRSLLAGLVGAAFTLAVVIQLVISERRVAVAAFRVESEERVLAIRHRLDDVVSSLVAAVLPFGVTGPVERSVLRELAAPALARHPFLHSVSWSPRVTAARRASFEAELHAATRVGHGIRERTEAFELIPAAARDEYFPVGAIEPLPGNEVAVGFDLASLPDARAALERTRETGELSLAGPLPLPRLRGTHALVAFLPHHAADVSRATPAERPTVLDGVFVGVIQLPHLIESAIAPLDPAAIEILVVETTVDHPPRVLYAHGDEADLAMLEHAGPHARAAGGSFSHVAEFEIGGREWTLLLGAGEGYLASQRSLAPWVALLGGTLSTGILVLHLRSLRERTRRVECLVSERTRELRESNRVLAAEVIQRKRAEGDLEQHRVLLEQRVRGRTSELAELNEELQREVEQRRQAECTLREEEQRLRLTLESIADGAWDWDLASGEVTFSEGWLRSFGYWRQEVRPHVSSWEALIHPEDRARVLECLKTHLDGWTDVYQCEYRLRAASGEYRWTLDRGRVVRRDAEGRPLRMVGTDADITPQKRGVEERERLQQQLQHAQKLESLGVLAGGIAHDFNNLLVAILGGADLALAELPASSPARLEIEQIQLAARRAADLTRQMLAYSGRSSVEAERIDLGALVEEMVDLLRASISKKAELRCDFEPEQPVVEGDATQLRQVVMNLITNASDALEERSGIVTVRTGSGDLNRSQLAGALLGEGLAPGRYACVEVSDTGSGMSAEVQARIFDPFFTTKFTGRGLGLAAVLGIVRSHRGAIQLRSQPGRGTRFRILLPHAQGRGDVPEAATSASAAGWRGSGTILVADDEEAVRRLAERVLSDAGFEVLAAADGREAVEIFGAHAARIRLVLLDMTMPEMSGDEAFRELRSIRGDVRVVLSSGYDAERSASTASSDAGVVFLQKPYRPQELIEKVRGALDA